MSTTTLANRPSGRNQAARTKTPSSGSIKAVGTRTPSNGSIKVVGASGLRVVALRRKKDGVAVLELAGRGDRGPLDRGSIAEARRRLLQLSPGGFVVDATALESLPVTTFAALLADAPRLFAAGGGVFFTGLRPELVDALWRSGWVVNHHPLFNAYATQDEAAAAFAARTFDPARLEARRLVVSQAQTSRGVARLQLSGALDAAAAVAVDAPLQELLRSPSAPRVILDVTGVVDAELEGLERIAAFARGARAHGGALVVAGAWGALAKLLEAYTSDLAVGVAASVGDAEERFGH